MKKLHRLFEMGPTEIAFRSRQEIYKAMERLSPPPADQDYRCHFDRSPPRVLYPPSSPLFLFLLLICLTS